LEVPQIDDNFQTNQQGVFVIGELGGLGLIKNAVTEGRLVVEKIAESHEAREGILDLVIVGAGPAGLSAGLSAKEAGFSAVILEQGSLANTIRRFPNRKIVMAEPVQIPMYGSLWVSDAPKETLINVWQTIIQSAGIEINENEPVLQVRRNGNKTLIVSTSKREYECSKVILAIGKRGTPNELQVPGAAFPKVLYHLADTSAYTNKRIVVVGGGDSAVEAAIGLSKQKGNQVTLSYRRKEFTRLRERNLKSLEACVQEGTIRLFMGSEVVEVGERDVLLEAGDGECLRLENDYVFAFIGGSSPKHFLEKIGIPMVTKEVAMEGSVYE
jgi:putative YpdA family bacillithiol system oxidoreductase